MTLTKEEITESLKKNRPNLSDKSCKTYSSTLLALYNRMDGKGGVDWFNKNANEILEAYEDKTPSQRKSVLSAVFIISKDDKIHKQMLMDTRDVNEQFKKQKMSENQEDNWLTWSQIEDVFKQLSDIVTPLYKKAGLTATDLSLMSKHILLACFVLQPPRRALDFSETMIRNFAKEKNNFIDLKKKTITYNIYKTAKQYGSQTFPIPEPLLVWLKKWVKINTSDYLLINERGENLTSNGVTKALINIFQKFHMEKDVSVDIIRHSFLTNYYMGKSMPPLLEMEEMAKKMAHSVNMALQYVKTS